MTARSQSPSAASGQRGIGRRGESRPRQRPWRPGKPAEDGKSTGTACERTGGSLKALTARARSKALRARAAQITRRALSTGPVPRRGAARPPPPRRRQRALRAEARASAAAAASAAASPDASAAGTSSRRWYRRARAPRAAAARLPRAWTRRIPPTQRHRTPSSSTSSSLAPDHTRRQPQSVSTAPRRLFSNCAPELYLLRTTPAAPAAWCAA